MSKHERKEWSGLGEQFSRIISAQNGDSDVMEGYNKGICEDREDLRERMVVSECDTGENWL